MEQPSKRLIDLYVYQEKEQILSFLLMRRAGGKIYGGQWRMVGGKAGDRETHWQAALRELKEETGLIPDLFWSVPTINHFYEPKTDQVHLIPVFAAEITGDPAIVLDDEHTEFRWVEAGNAGSYIFWPEQKRIIACINSIVINKRILQDWIIEFDHT
ncbi:MAG: NUDIX domain-containing protein [Balneolaceae bacterium]